MCGIWLEVLAVNSEHNNNQNGESPKNLSRRGPDHVGCVNCDAGGNHQVKLQASVLKMRSHCTLQPVTLQLPDCNSMSMSMHLAWNGEVYQMRTADADNADFHLETVAGYEIADTQLVADRLLNLHSRLFDQYQHGDNESFLDAFADSLAHQVMGGLVNAEYAFCIVTPWAIYYGRDPWGRRSLLYWDDTLKEEEESDNNVQKQECPSIWKLQSVTEQEDSKSNDDNKKVWSEVPPGMVHEYRFESGRFRSTPIPRIVWNNLPITLPTTPNPPDNNATPSMWKASLALEHYLRQAVKLRVCGNANPQTQDVAPIPIAVLFSGGIDSVLLAALALQVLPPQEPLRLWNVSFVDQHTEGAPTTAQDCLAAQASYEELLQLFPNHTILLETTEVSWEEMTEWEPHIRTLLHPKSTTMDLNIAMALWFASRGRQINNNDMEMKESATSTVIDPRILLVGMGADEQLGGYGRHRKAFQRALEGSEGEGASTRSANECLRQELDLDIGRLWERNLGRDDRIFSDHGKEARFPYLDHHVTNFMAQTPLEDVCDYSLPPGQGDKRILRLLAMRLGLKTASGMVKRAIQFGSRIAHVSDKRRFGSRRKAKGTAAV